MITVLRHLACYCVSYLILVCALFFLTFDVLENSFNELLDLFLKGWFVFIYIGFFPLIITPFAFIFILRCSELLTDKYFLQDVAFTGIFMCLWAISFCIYAALGMLAA